MLLEANGGDSNRACRCRLSLVRCEVAGTNVLKTGEGVHRLREGDGAVGVPWFYYTLVATVFIAARIEEVFCDRSQVTGVTVNGGFAEFMVAWENHVVPIPSTLKLELAAPLFLCRWHRIQRARKSQTR